MIPPVVGKGLRITVLGTPVTVDWTFLLIIALFALGGARPWQYGLMFAGVAFVSILWHEAGHAVALAATGRRSTILIHAMGGLTIGEEKGELRDGESIGISLAGPLAGMVVGLVAVAFQQADVGQHQLWSYVLLHDLVFVNLGWGAINLLPVLPLDGGHVMERLTNRVAPNWADTLPYLISIAIAVPAGIYGWHRGLKLTLLFALGFAALNVHMLIGHRRETAERDLAQRANDALDLLASSTPDRAIDALESVVRDGPPPRIAGPVMVGLAWALAWRLDADDEPKLTYLVGQLAGRRDTAFLGAALARRRGADHEAQALMARGFASESTPPPPWFTARMLPSTESVDALAAWIEQLSHLQRHLGLGRLAASLESSGRPADANRVRSHSRRGVATPAFSAPLP